MWYYLVCKRHANNVNVTKCLVSIMINVAIHLQKIWAKQSWNISFILKWIPSVILWMSYYTTRIIYFIIIPLETRFWNLFSNRISYLANNICATIIAEGTCDSPWKIINIHNHKKQTFYNIKGAGSIVSKKLQRNSTDVFISLNYNLC